MTSRRHFATSFIQLISVSYCIPIISSYFQKIDENSNNRQPIIFLSSPYIHLYQYVPICIYIYIIWPHPPVSPRPCASCPRSLKACGCPNRPSSRCCHPHSNTNASFFPAASGPGKVGSKARDTWIHSKSGARPGELTVCELEHGPVEIVDFPINSMVIFHCYVNVHQRVTIGFLPSLQGFVVQCHFDDSAPGSVCGW